MASNTEEAPIRLSDALPESKLGTKAHWDEVYERELNNWKDHGDEGEVWFGEEAVDRMVSYLEQAFEDGTIDLETVSSDEHAILDLGMGNGHLLFALHESSDVEVPPTSMLGIDYSPASVSLAKRIGKEKGEEAEEVRFEQADLLDDDVVERLAGANRWAIVCDKGTMDAIALSSQLIRGRLPVDLYTRAVAKLTRPGGIFLITSCNFTKDELIRRFTEGDDRRPNWVIHDYYLLQAQAMNQKRARKSPNLAMEHHAAVESHRMTPYFVNMASEVA
ncbi:Protein-lysine N-methyltransferase efm4 [Tilletia horrida]|nr:Protein-lysine N-methyltransferase efm4 [Tilletia horrida]